MAARIASEIRRLDPGITLAAVPLVGLGKAYLAAGIEVTAPRLDLPSGGLLFHSMPLLLADLRAGIVGLTVAQLSFLARSRASVRIAVGDIYAQLLSTLGASRERYFVQTLVSALHEKGAVPTRPNRLFMERITLPERAMMRGLARAVFVRDEATEVSLRAAGVSNCHYLGNPMADGLEGVVPASLVGERRVVALLPGSRAYRQRSLSMMLAALEQVHDVTGAVAWVGGELALPPGWTSLPPEGSDDGLVAILRKEGRRVLVFEGRFADLLQAARVVLGTSGTANEQAVASARPVVAFPLPPDYGTVFLENQKRLLGPALTLAPADPGSIAEAVTAWLDDPAAADLAGRQGRARIGGPGGSAAVASFVLKSARRSGALR